MQRKSPNKDDAIVIVGAGIFGLSTALHLARRGYQKVTVFDKQAYDKTLYSYFSGCDAASADINKIIRSAYGTQTEYQELTFEAIDAWKAWNDELESGVDLPPGLNTSDRVFYNSGMLSMTDGDEIAPFELATIQTMEEAGHTDTQFVTTDERHRGIAGAKGFGVAMDPFLREEKGKPNIGVLDSTGGIAVADKACRFALHKARGFGVKFVLEPIAGSFESLLYGSRGKVIGIRTKDGKTHTATLIIMACGGWTPSLIPQLDGVCETTAGSVVMVRIPQASPLFSRFAPERFPSWAYKIKDGAEGGLYGFPRDDRGYLKIGYRGTKYTNPKIQDDGSERSVPVTRFTEPENMTQIPSQALKVINEFMEEYIPELADEGIEIEQTRLCWYTDSFDNHFVIDQVPDHHGLMVATGGSGHAFKYLPNIGNWVVDIIESVGTDRPAVKLWKWRESDPENIVNVLMEGSQGDRALQNVSLASDEQLKLISNR